MRTIWFIAILIILLILPLAYPACDIYWGIRTVVQKAHATFPGARIVVTSILPRGTNLMGADDKIRAVNSALKDTAASANFAFFDPHDAFLCGNKTPCPLFQLDLNLHLTKAGYELLTKLLQEFMTQEHTDRDQNIPAPNAPVETGSPQIWIKGGAHVVAPPLIWRGIRQDTADMWNPDAPWQTVAGHVQAVEFPPGNIESAKDEDLKKALSDLRRRNLTLALGTGLLARSAHCSSTTEAYVKPEELAAILEKIRRNGGDLQYIAMDEPFYYGHKDASGCHESAAELAREVAKSVAMARRIFPKVQVGDIEVVGASRPWIDELAQWADAYRAAVGKPLAFFQTDIGWSELAMRNLAPLAQAMKKRNIPLAIIYNGEGATDESWELSAVNHFTEIESTLGVQPGMAVFDTWDRYPSHMLPENQPGTLTNLVLQYLRPVTSLAISHQGNTIAGRLTDSRGKPVPNASVQLEAIDVGARMGLTDRSLAGKVPDGAANAIIGIRANLEGSCVCAGGAGVSIGGIHYREQGTGKQQDISPVSSPIQGASASVRALKLTADKTFAPNLRQFPVTPGATYTLTAPIMATAGAEHAGYVTLIFQDSTGKGLRRDFLWFSPSTSNLGKAVTGSDGRFQFQLPANVTLARPEIRVNYPGSQALRPAMAVLPL